MTGMGDVNADVTGMSETVNSSGGIISEKATMHVRIHAILVHYLVQL